MANEDDKYYKRFNVNQKEEMKLVYDPTEEINKKTRSYIKQIVNDLFKQE